MNPPILKAGILGSGDVAKALAAGLLQMGYEVMMGTRDPAKLADWKAVNSNAQIGSFADATEFAEVVVLAVKGTVAAEALHLAGSSRLAGKTVIDATNPIADLPPEDGVLRYFTDHNQSLLERLQSEFPEAHLVKAFNSVGSRLMVHPQLPGGPPTMFYCGNDASAKERVRAIIEGFGWEPYDMGRAAAARAIEPLCLLWCLPGFTGNEWNHAFKLLR